MAKKDAIQELMESLSPEERAILEKLTGQANQGGGKKTPVVKVNFNRVDVNGKKANKGNFVVGQKAGLVEGKPATLEIGTDLGDTLEAVILKSVTQYSYYSNDPKKRCSSQLICDRGETPIGSTLKNVCNDKSCPRRKEGVDKNEKCTNQYILFLRLPEGTKLPDGSDCPVAMMYLKGTNYMPIKEYFDDLKGTPSIAIKTIFTTTEEGGAVSYWQTHIKKGAPVSSSEFKELFQLVSGIDKQLVEHKEDMKQKMLEAPKSNTFGDTTGSVTVVNGDDENIIW